MSSGVLSEFKEQIRSRTNLVELVGENVALKALRGGTDFVGLCPFHDDHNPSFHVYPDRQTYRCWVCQEGGDCFSYVMKYEGVEFREAMQQLATRAGLEVPRLQRSAGTHAFGNEFRNSSQDGSNRSDRATVVGPGASEFSAGIDGTETEISKTRLYDVLQWAELEFHQCLKNASVGKEALNYLRNRGFSEQTIDRFRLGYHPADWNWILHRARGKFSEAELLAARLVNTRREGNGCYDYFVDRVIFPIHDERGRSVAFGGRVLPGRDDGQAGKYFNSPESPVFHKSRLLFGLQEARDAIRKEVPRTAVVVEGYADCIMCQQHGLANVVGTLGTALAESHVLALKRFADRVVLVFDGDGAGKMAAERSLGKFLAQDVDLRVLTLPPGSKDPDEFLQQHGADAFRELMGQAVDVLTYKLGCLVNRHGLESSGGRDAVLKEMLELLAESRSLSGTEREDKSLGWLSQRLVVKQEFLRQELQRLRRAAVGRLSAHAVQRSNPVEGRMSTSDAGGLGEKIRPNSDPSSFRGESAQIAASRKNSFLQGQRTRHDLIEAELLEILFLKPEWIEAVRWQVSVEDFQHEELKKLAQYCFDFLEQGEIPTFDRLMCGLEDPALKQLAVYLEEMARKKGLEGLMEATAERRPLVTGGMAAAGHLLQSGLPPFLMQVLQRLTWRQREKQHLQPRLQVAQMTEATSGLDPDSLELLRAIHRHHQHRAVRTPSTSAAAENHPAANSEE